MKELIGESIAKLKSLLASKQITAVEILDAHISQIEKYEGSIDSFLTFTFEKARQQAKTQDENLSRTGALPLLGGIPLAIKDNMCFAGEKTTCGSKMLENFVSPYTGTAVEKLIESGALILGKTNLDEFAMGSSTEHSAYKRTKNPINVDYVPGGSSGGSAASVAAGFTVCALGSDTGGSIRQPASFCGLVGMKPTYGTVSRYGLVAFASSLDQIGPFARSVEDCAMTLLAISGHDRKDSTSLPDHCYAKAGEPSLSEQYIKDFAALSAEENLAGLRIGLIKELIGEGIDEEVRNCVLAAADKLRAAGAVVEEVSLPHARYALPVYYIIATAEASANLARFDGVRYGHRDMDASELHSMYYASRQKFGAEVKRRIMLGTYALSSGYYDAYYKKAQQVRRLITQDFEKIFADFDLVISPTSPCAAFKFDEKTDDPLKMYMSDIASIPANLAGLPGISLNCGTAASGALKKDLLPVGLQLLGRPLSDARLLKAANGVQALLDLKFVSPLIKQESKISAS